MSRRTLGIVFIIVLAVLASYSVFAAGSIGSEYAGASRVMGIIDPTDLSFTTANRTRGAGPHGRFEADGVTSWIADFALTCPRTGDLPLRLVEEGSVVTYSHLSQLTLQSTDGEVCLALHDFSFSGEVRGVITGGSGRFEGASGAYVRRFEGKQIVQDFQRVSGELIFDLDRR